MKKSAKIAYLLTNASYAVTRKSKFTIAKETSYIVCTDAVGMAIMRSKLAFIYI